MEHSVMKIEHIDELLPHVQGRKDFIVARRDGYTVIDYSFMDGDTFDHPARVQCRGIKFGPDGRTLARPFHKFFNLGERPHLQPELIDMSQPHVIMEKLDGSMIHPAIVRDRLVFMTRMGHTDVAKRAELLMTIMIAQTCRELLETGLTPIFEYTVPENRIIIQYERQELRLLAIRSTIEGTYVPQVEVDTQAAALGVRAVSVVTSQWATARDFSNYVRAVQGAEGFVLRFDDGLWLKAKGEDYVLKHRSVSEIAREKNALALVLTNGVDDLLPLLRQEEQTALLTYQTAVRAKMNEMSADVEKLVNSGAHLDQKAFAVEHLKGVNEHIRSVAFMVRRGMPAAEAVKELLLKNTGSQTKVDYIRSMIGAEWKIRDRTE
jgi:RNA ligase